MVDNDPFGDDFEECQTFSISVQPNNAPYTAVPPYYMVAFEISGIPTTTNIGQNPTNLTWQNTHKQGSLLVMTVIDSNTSGNVPHIGGTADNFNSVIPGDTSCLPTAVDPSKVPTVHANETDNLATCEEWDHGRQQALHHRTFGPGLASYEKYINGLCRQRACLAQSCGPKRHIDG
ncbi:hypothetical protein PHLGIDRAFT_311064 [Phlebiopsis gigantea 11061_1 CR5-6]|uniref:Uncharacterized protein n=1 Tax=Phlebiopsis gigantea (strain 11061_1 CR5-6) TaxID=745531 RepID=A0A0C3PB11_PHLG1|nr:hypothetical protein PHLGIDRAFT_311064 [Phlebiopsis gigantea 11061_1 CR5-6]